jgi:hypothetical protein
MYLKCNVDVTIKQGGNKYFVRLVEIDPLKNDVIDGKWIENNSFGYTSEPLIEKLEFLFPISDTGEFNPELQIVVFSETGERVYESEVNKEISMIQIKSSSTESERTTIQFKSVEL